MVYPIYLYGEDVLRKKAEDVDLNDPTLPSLIEDMFSTMRIANGAGLAAPQIGISKKLIVVEEKISEEKTFKIVLINPKLIGVGGDNVKFEEACLSLPGISADVNRPFMIGLEWYDENKEYHKEIFTEIESRIIQHELDHLDGKLYIDHLHPDVRMKLFMVLEDIKNRNIKVNYLIK
jgi:peptide deformylase